MPPAAQRVWRGAVSRRRALLRTLVKQVLVHAFLLAGAVFMLLPFVWMLITSMKAPDDIFRATLSLWPR